MITADEIVSACKKFVTDDKKIISGGFWREDNACPLMATVLDRKNIDNIREYLSEDSSSFEEVLGISENELVSFYREFDGKSSYDNASTEMIVIAKEVKARLIAEGLYNDE